jgi:uncharacterized protein YjbI with pentapeptide repeats
LNDVNKDSKEFWNEIDEMLSEMGTDDKTDFSGFYFIPREGENLIDFLKTEFTEIVYFHSATFSCDVSFTRAKFLKTVSFADVEFFGFAGFRDADFFGDTFFNDAIFHGECLFMIAEFADRVLFPNAAFLDDVDFGGAKFFKAALFPGSVFEQNALFSSVDFSGETKFEKAVFSSAYFNNTRFSDSVNFYETDFAEHVSFLHVDFDVEEKAKFHKTNLTKASFLYTDVSKLNFLDPEWPIVKGKLFNRRACYDETENKDYPAIESVYRQLKHNYEENRNYPVAGDFYIGEMEMRRKNPNTRKTEKLLFDCYKVLGLYGESFKLPVFWFIILLTFSTFEFQYIGDSNMTWIKSFKTALKFSYLRPDFNDTKTFLEVFLGLFTSVFGVVLIAMSAIGIKRKVRR